MYVPRANINTGSICLVACCGLGSRVKPKSSHTAQRDNYGSCWMEGQREKAERVRDNKGLSIPDGTEMYSLSVTLFSLYPRQAVNVSIKPE
ncbi:hypothetical protein QQF64_003650 [Cirrhinus molitorella]|uniref:Uncharacterized protein n=1 Tax=Cirrhinus molitorella TaxID=172907 RepID=A0ABR3MLW7_9TELE